MLLIVTDAHPKWPEVQVMTTTTASKTIEVLREMFARDGIPEYLVSDNGPQFVSAEFGNFYISDRPRIIQRLMGLWNAWCRQ